MLPLDDCRERGLSDGSFHTVEATKLLFFDIAIRSLITANHCGSAAP
jgi:hypothetical protein